jgi:multisubunit Na+/H+ antiporter MnhE subunit
MAERHQADQRGDSAPGSARPRLLFLVVGGLLYAAALLGVWTVLAGEVDAQDLVAGSAAAVIAVGVACLVSQRGSMVPSVRVADLRTLAVLPWQVVAETGQVFALAARKAAGRRVAAGALCTVPIETGTDACGWPAARREAVLTALLSAAPKTIVLDIDMAAGTALVHQLTGASPSDEHPSGGQPAAAGSAPRG